MRYIALGLLLEKIPVATAASPTKHKFAMYKIYNNLSTGETVFFNETCSTENYIEGFDSNGNFHHVVKSGNMRIDTTTGDTYIKTGNYYQKTGSADVFHCPFGDEEPHEL